jgi:CRP/FNR family cyclic AMP-dependent transcriptional regulator
MNKAAASSETAAKQPKLSLEVLEQIPLFQHLNSAERQHIAQAAETAQYKPGEEILQQGGQCQNLWVVLEGECEVVKHTEDGESREVVLATLGPYENFGEMSFFHAAPHSAAVRARTPLRVLKLSRDAYLKLIDHGVGAAFKLAYNTVNSLATRLRRANEWVARLITENAKKDQVAEWSGFREKLFKEWNL